MNAGGPVLHVDFVLLKEDADEAHVEALSTEAGSLDDIEGVQRIGVISAGEESDFNLAFIFLLDSLSNLEAFGTDPRYIKFLQGGLAKTMRSFGGADVQLLGAYQRSGAFAACAALAATPQTYDWQIRDALAAWQPDAAIGLAPGERQRYRGVGVMFSNQPIPRPASGFEGFGLDFTSGPYQLLA